MAAGRVIVVQPNVVNDAVAVGVEQGAKYALIGPDGTRVVFNDRSDTDFVGFLTAPPSGIDSAEVRESSDLLTEADGGVHGAFYYGRRPVTLEGIIDPSPGPLDFAESLAIYEQNVVPNPNGATVLAPFVGFADGGSAGTNGSVADTTDASAAGAGQTRALEVTANSMPAGTSLYLFSTTAFAACAPGQSVRASARVKIQAGTANGVSLYVRFHDAAGNTLQDFIAQGIALPGNGWVQYDGPATAPAGAAGVSVYVQGLFAAGNNAMRMHNVNLMLSPHADAPAYFDGASFPAGVALRTAWVGTPENSVSTLYAVTRRNLEPGEVANRRINRLQRASRAMRADCRLEWTPSTAPPVRITARRQQPLRVTSRLPKTFQLSLVAADSRIYGQAVRGGAAALGSSQTVTSDGNAPTPPVITIRGTGTVASPLAITSGGSTVNLALGLVANDVLVVDFAARTILLNGTNRYDALVFATSAWWDVQPGLNVITVSGGSTAGTWEVAYRDAFQ